MKIHKTTGYHGKWGSVLLIHSDGKAHITHNTQSFYPTLQPLPTSMVSCYELCGRSIPQACTYPSLNPLPLPLPFLYLHSHTLGTCYDSDGTFGCIEGQSSRPDGIYYKGHIVQQFQVSNMDLCKPLQYDLVKLSS